MPRRRPNRMWTQRRRITLQQALRGYAVRTLSDLAGLGDAGTLSPAEIQAVAANAGFSGADLATAVAIALAESQPPGNPNSYNQELRAGAPQGKGSYGLWQIFLFKHPEFAGWNLYDPQTNANAAFALYQQAGGFSPWATYNSGAYRGFLPMAAGAGSSSSTAPVSTGASPPPLTIDASTGLPIDDFTPTPTARMSGGTIILIGLGALATYLAADALLD